MNYSQCLKQAKKINDNENVNKILLTHLVNQDLVWLYDNLASEVTDNFLQSYLKLVNEYHQGYPLAYILGYVFFLNHKLLVDKNVLIPRDETEALVLNTLEISNHFFHTKQLKVLDLCTGSGCIALSLAIAQPNWKITASDVSSLALKVAQNNINEYHLKNITLVESNLFGNLSNKKFDIIICNPPYINQNSQTYNSAQLQHEPKIALFAPEEGLFFYHQIFENALSHLNEKFLLAFEIGFDQKDKLELLIKAIFPNNIDFIFMKDLNNHWRYLFIKSPL